MRAVYFLALVSATAAAPVAEGAWQCTQTGGGILSSHTPDYCARYYPNCAGVDQMPAACASPNFQTGSAAAAAPASRPAQYAQPAAAAANVFSQQVEAGAPRRAQAAPAWRPLPAGDVPTGALSTTPGCKPVQYSRQRRPTEFRIGRFTNYEPQKRGINGRCGRSATRGVDACQYFFEDHLQGSRPGVVVAVSQRGGSANLFGGLYRLDPIQGRLPASEGRKLSSGSGCLVAIAADRYGTGSNNMPKMDVVTRANSRYANVINGARGRVVLVGTLQEMRSNGNRRPVRKPGAAD